MNDTIWLADIHVTDIFDNPLVPGADPGFQVKGGVLEKIAPSGGRRENFWGISYEKSYFLQF